ncbi:MAG: small basic family protein [Gaiellales bacterium]|nr:small basic family protein [Gaiellales bacterium]
MSPAPRRRLYLPLAGLAVGVVVGLLIQFDLPVAYARYLTLVVLVALDSALGGLRAALEHQFEDRLLLTGFLWNAACGVGLAFLGDHLGANLYLAVVLALGLRLFRTAAALRRLVFT